MNILRPFLILVILGLAISCSSSSSDDSPENSDDFDRGAMLVNLADNSIIPAFQDLSTKLITLKSNKDAFVSATNQTNLDALRTSWLDAYKTWQHVEMYNIGKAEAILYTFQMNIYPVSTTDVEANIASGTYDLGHVNNNDAVGFPALDYMLHGIAIDDAAILSKYADINYKNYLSDLVDQMESLTTTVLNDWTTSYRTTFINSTENTATSAVNKLVNDYIFYYEKGLRANKFGIPAGVFSTTPLPEKVEGYYNQEISRVLALEALNAVQDFFNGKKYNGTTLGESFESYLIHLEKNELAQLINSRFDDARAKIELLDANFYAQINADNTKMTQAYDALQLGVISLKVDMLQAFNISVDYVDADGD